LTCWWYGLINSSYNIPIVKLSLLPVGNTSALPTVVTVLLDWLIWDPRTLTNALGLKPTSEKAADEYGVAPKYMGDYLAVAGILLVPTNGSSANAI